MCACASEGRFFTSGQSAINNCAHGVTSFLTRYKQQRWRTESRGRKIQNCVRQQEQRRNLSSRGTTRKGYPLNMKIRVRFSQKIILCTFCTTFLLGLCCFQVKWRPCNGTGVRVQCTSCSNFYVGYRYIPAPTLYTCTLCRPSYVRDGCNGLIVLFVFCCE